MNLRETYTVKGEKIPKFSVIIPVYEVEKVLYRCLESIVNQTFTDFECILVDDCSPDNCGAICDEYAAKDKRFKVIHKPQNEGLPKTRKSGLDIAQGEFVIHVDSDDWLELNALELLHKEFMKTNADIVIGSMRCLFNKKSIVFTPPNTIDTYSSALEYFFLNKVEPVAGKGYRRALFTDYIVPPVYMGEDVITNVQIFSKMESKKIRIIDSVVYNYDKHHFVTSSGKTVSLNSFSETSDAPFVQWVENYINSICNDSKITDAFNYFVIIRLLSYVRFNTTITHKEICLLYEKYYIPCSHKNKIRLLNRICFSLYAKHFATGKAAVFLFNFMARIVKKLIREI